MRCRLCRHKKLDVEAFSSDQICSYCIHKFGNEAAARVKRACARVAAVQSWNKLKRAWRTASERQNFVDPSIEKRIKKNKDMDNKMANMAKKANDCLHRHTADIGFAGKFCVRCGAYRLHSDWSAPSNTLSADIVARGLGMAKSRLFRVFGYPVNGYYVLSEIRPLIDDGAWRREKADRQGIRSKVNAKRVQQVQAAEA